MKLNKKSELTYRLWCTVAHQVSEPSCVIESPSNPDTVVCNYSTLYRQIIKKTKSVRIEKRFEVAYKTRRRVHKGQDKIGFK